MGYGLTREDTGCETEASGWPNEPTKNTNLQAWKRAVRSIRRHPHAHSCEAVTALPTAAAPDSPDIPGLYTQFAALDSLEATPDLPAAPGLYTQFAAATLLCLRRRSPLASSG